MWMLPVCFFLCVWHARGSGAHCCPCLALKSFALQWLHDDGCWACPHAWYSPLMKIYMSSTSSSVHIWHNLWLRFIIFTLRFQPRGSAKTVGGWMPCSRGLLVAAVEEMEILYAVIFHHMWGCQQLALRTLALFTFNTPTSMRQLQ